MTFENPDPSSLLSADDAAAELLGGATPPAAGETAAAPTLEEVAARAEAELAAEDPDVKTDLSPSKLKELIDTKYGGDEGKFVDGLHEQWKSTAALKKELDALKAQISNQAEPEPEAELPPSTEHPDVKWLDQRITALVTESERNVAAQQNLEAKGHAIKSEISELRGEMKRAEDVEKTTLEDRISRKEAELERLADRWQRLSSRNAEIEEKGRDFERQKHLAVREADVAKAQLQQQRVELRNYQKDQGEIFSKALEEAVAEYQLPTADPEYAEYLEETIRAKVSYTLRSDPNNGPLDLAAEAKKQVSAFARAHALTKKAALSQTTREKLQVTTKTPVAVAPKPSTVNPQAPTTAQTPSSPRKWTADFARQRAMKILGG